MNLNNISLPYPVLGISDDVLPILSKDSIIVNMESDNQNYVLILNSLLIIMTYNLSLTIIAQSFHVSTNADKQCLDVANDLRNRILQSPFHERV